MGAEKLVIPSLAGAKEFEGRSLGPSAWLTITQDRIDAFADATDDHQWIHCDVDRATRESPWKSTIAHGYLTLSLTPELLGAIVEIVGWKTAVNTGLDRLRLSAPVPSGSRIRLHGEIKKVRELKGGAVRISFGIRFEVEGEARPALLADVNYAYFP